MCSLVLVVVARHRIVRGAVDEVQAIVEATISRPSSPLCAPHASVSESVWHCRFSMTHPQSSLYASETAQLS